jgi:hypothetical protein
MSQTSSTNADYPNFQSIFDDAVKAYDEKTKGNITEDPLLAVLAPCKSANDVLIVLRQKEESLTTSKNDAESITKWLTPTIHVLCAFSSAIAQGVGLVSIGLFTSSGSMVSCMLCFQVFPPANVISAGIGVLLSVSTCLFPSRYAIVTPKPFRRPKMSKPAKKYSPFSLLVSKAFLLVLIFTSKSRRPRL